MRRLLKGPSSFMHNN
ncbi:Protein of unknown function [Bacillus cereus]|uniref:Uncharacterized protein n=1 Tax=Bacillus wiedmannii TaxID=1890302 RepID=A0A1C4BEJ7_9BACI|nr:Protein of unknown function [Bacillus cereus]SCC05240.1 Protein of unknown function [Bacillus wiedmannii]SCL87276.1 Protein of unknown function [Bacillus wiedmannii]SCM92443.1 Protein of unknown function [Bacillus cereus]SCN01864.1 Protein of unknown function [Bacillus wiedmannii]